MLLTAGAVTEVMRFLQLLCWIILPIFIIAGGVTAFMHYRKKKRNVASSTGIDSNAEIVLPTPEKFAHRKNNGEYIFFDHSDLISDYKTKLSYHQAKHSALQHDYSSLDARYNSLALYLAQTSTSKNNTMKEFTGELSSDILEEVNKRSAAFEAERKELRARMEQLAKSYESLEENNRSLEQQLILAGTNEQDKQELSVKLGAENLQLKDRVAEQDYLNDVLEEKKMQIGFLQAQLEQRIRSEHHAEQQRQQAISEMEQAKAELHHSQSQYNHLQQELLLCQDDADKLRMELVAKDEESAAQEAKFQQNVDNHVAQIQQLEQKLSSHKQLLLRLYQECGSFLEDEQGKVVGMRSA